jgi:hypothetical protein
MKPETEEKILWGAIVAASVTLLLVLKELMNNG